jgi:hypothetical protein
VRNCRFPIQEIALADELNLVAVKVIKCSAHFTSYSAYICTLALGAQWSVKSHTEKLKMSLDCHQHISRWIFSLQGLVNMEMLVLEIKKVVSCRI